MDVQLYLFINGAWQEYNPKPAVHSHTISEVNGLQSALNNKANNNDVVKLSGTQTITGKKTITTNDLNMDGASVAYIRPNTTGGWARGFWWQTRSTDSPANTRIGGIGVLGNNQSVSYFYIGYGSSPWTNPAVEIRSDYTNIRNGLKLNGNDVATVPYLNNALSEYAKKDHTHNGVYEPVFTKNTAFNKNFGTGNGDVARGNHTHNDYPMKLIRSRGATSNLTNTGAGVYGIATSITLNREKTIMVEVNFNSGSYASTSKIVTISLGYATSTPNATTNDNIVSVPIWNNNLSKLYIYSFSVSYSGSTLYFGNKTYTSIGYNTSAGIVEFTNTINTYSLYVGKIWVV